MLHILCRFCLNLNINNMSINVMIIETKLCIHIHVLGYPIFVMNGNDFYLWFSYQGKNNVTSKKQ